MRIRMQSLLLLLILYYFAYRLSFDFLLLFYPCNLHIMLLQGFFLYVQVLVQRIFVRTNTLLASYNIPSILSVISFAHSIKYKNPYIDAIPNIPKRITYPINFNVFFLFSFLVKLLIIISVKSSIIIVLIKLCLYKYINFF